MEVNRRTFLRTLLASTATIVVVPELVLDALPPPPGDPHRVHVDMGRKRCGLVWLDPLEAMLGPAEDGSIRYAIDNWSVDGDRSHELDLRSVPGLTAGIYVRASGRWRRQDDFLLHLDARAPVLLLR